MIAITRDNSVARLKYEAYQHSIMLIEHRGISHPFHISIYVAVLILCCVLSLQQAFPRYALADVRIDYRL